MAKHANHAHYERAFEAYVRSCRMPCVPVNQLRRAADEDGPIKGFDFLVHAGDRHYIVDVKGRRFPRASKGREIYWENWIHFSDIEGLFAWERHFGEGYTGLLAFCYWLQAPAAGEGPAFPAAWRHGERDYLMVAVTAQAYAEHCRRRSTRWHAVHVPEKAFTSLAKPIAQFIAPAGGA